MTRRPSSKARLALLGDVLKLLRQRRRPIDCVLIHPDGTIEVRLTRPNGDDATANEPGGWSEYDSTSR